MKKISWYETWEEAGQAAIKLGITNIKEYRKFYKNDCRLPSCPLYTYKNFPGWKKFLEGKKYLFWQYASKAAIRLGITGRTSYKKLYRKDRRLPSSPFHFYKEFPGWPVFLGKYRTWGEAAQSAIMLNIKTETEYRKRHHEDSSLPGDPNDFYDNFPGYPTFLGKKESNSTQKEVTDMGNH